MRRFRKTYYDPEPIGASRIYAFGPLTIGYSRGLLQFMIAWGD